jgi:hypothetical protein
LAIQLEEIEGVEKDVLFRRLAPQLLERRKPVLIAGDRLPSIRQERTLCRSTASTMSG